MIYFITSNEGKFNEALRLLPNLKKLSIDLPEIQELDSRVIIKEKLFEALKISNDEFIVDDTGLHLECLNGFPGPLIKWLLKSIGDKGIYELCERLGNNKAIAKTIIGYANNKELRFFESTLSGVIVKPRGINGFGWDSIFKPDGYNKTLAEMDVNERNSIKMRAKALMKLKDYLSKK